MSIFERHLQAIEGRLPHFTVPLSNGLTFVFQRLDSYLDYRNLIRNGDKVAKRFNDGHKVEAEEVHRPKTATAKEWQSLLTSAHFFAGIHIGFMDNGEFVEEKLEPHQFLALAAKDGLTFRRLFDALNFQCDVELMEPEDLDAYGLKKKLDGVSTTSSPPETSGDSTPIS